MKVWLEDNEIEVPAGMSLKDLAEQHADEYPAPLMMAKVNGTVQEFYHLVEDGSRIHLCTPTDNDGNRVFERGVTMMVLKAIHDVVPEDRLTGVNVEFTLYTGHFCKIMGKVDLDQKMLKRIEEKMREYVEADIPFIKKVIRTRDAVELFNLLRIESKSKLTKYRRNSRMTV